MKKLGLFVLLMVVFFSFTGVNAKTEEELKNILNQTIKVGKSEYSLSADEKVLVERYLEQNEVSSADADYIAARIDKAIEIIKKEGHADFKKFSKSSKDKLKALVAEISENTSVKATVTKNSLIVYNQDGTKVEVTKLVKQTGSETSKIAMIAGLSILIVAVGTCLVVNQVKTGE